ncbi:MAG: ATP-binding protein [Burkholderiales bacterium]|nr:ATP-binding protein [Burkholderiales bacterium]
MPVLPLLPSSQPLFRMVEENLRTSLTDTPVVLIQGPRQCGKTTLARTVAEPRGYGYISFDDDNLVRAARADPMGFVSDLPPRMVLDEVQRVPELFTSLKLVVDRDRQPGRFLLTGSANVLLLPKLADSLAGRIEVLRLHPLAQVELRRRSAGFLAQLFNADFRSESFERMGLSLAELVVAGGFPAALTRQSARRRSWYQAYAQTLIQRDVRDLARIASLDVMPRLLDLAARQTAHLFNVSELASPFGLSRPTVRDYLTLLERVFLVDLLPPWHTRHINRLVKTPKLHLNDTGLAAALLRVDAAGLHADRALLGQLLETFVFQELRRQASGSPETFAFYHFRNRDDHEVDIVIERGSLLAGIEVKASGTVRSEDFRGLRKLQEIAGERFACGVLLYDGEASMRFGPRLFALPVRTLWGGPDA